MKTIRFPLTVLSVFLAGMAIATPPEIKKEKGLIFDTSTTIAECTPFLWKNRPILLYQNWGSREEDGQYTPKKNFLQLRRIDTGEQLPDIPGELVLPCGFVEKKRDGQDVFHVFGAAHQADPEIRLRSIYHRYSTDLIDWTEYPEPAIPYDNEHLNNSSIAQGPDGSYVMAYESNSPVQYCVKFATSPDLVHWTKVPDCVYAGPDGKSYSACPTIRYYAPYYYVFYLKRVMKDGVANYHEVLIRSKDLRDWEEAKTNPFLSPTEDEGINNSDLDFFEWNGKTYLYYCDGDQSTWNNVKRAVYDGTEQELLESQF